MDFEETRKTKTGDVASLSFQNKPNIWIVEKFIKAGKNDKYKIVFRNVINNQSICLENLPFNYKKIKGFKKLFIKIFYH